MCESENARAQEREINEREINGGGDGTRDRQGGTRKQRKTQRDRAHARDREGTGEGESGHRRECGSVATCRLLCCGYMS